MPRLFPQLIAEIGQRAAADLSTMTVADAGRRADERSKDPSSNSVFAATGGTRVTSSELADLRSAIVAKAREHGFPAPRKGDSLMCDAHISVILREMMGISPNEAATDGLWEYLACILMPDLVIWRFQGAEGRTLAERFLAGRRNNFYRLWWRAYVLAGDLVAEEAVRLLSFLGEDEMVSMMERPRLFGNLRVIRLYCSEFRKAVENGDIGGRRQDVNREAQKRLRRLAAVRLMDSLPENTLRLELRGLIEQARNSLDRQAGRAST